MDITPYLIFSLIGFGVFLLLTAASFVYMLMADIENGAVVYFISAALAIFFKITSLVLGAIWLVQYLISLS